MITCNIVSGFPNRLARQLKNDVGYFDKIRVLLTNKSQQMLDVVNRFHCFDIDYYSIHDFYGADFSRNILSQFLDIGEWAFILDDDMILSQTLLDGIYSLIQEAEENNKNCVSFPFVNEWGGIQITPTDKAMEYSILTHTNELADQYNLNEPIHRSYFYEAIMLYHVVTPILWNNSMHPFAYSFPHNPLHSIYPIIHSKLIGEGWNSPIWVQLKGFYKSELDLGQVGRAFFEEIKASGIEPSLESALNHLRSGEITPKLKELIWENRESDLYGWFIVYYYMYHADELPPDFIEPISMQHFIDYYLFGRTNVSVLSLPMNDKMKHHLLKNGITIAKNQGTFEKL